MVIRLDFIAAALFAGWNYIIATGRFGPAMVVLGRVVGRCRLAKPSALERPERFIQRFTLRQVARQCRCRPVEFIKPLAQMSAQLSHHKHPQSAPWLERLPR